jgi:hypothetical protein
MSGEPDMCDNKKNRRQRSNRHASRLADKTAICNDCLPTSKQGQFVTIVCRFGK